MHRQTHRILVQSFSLLNALFLAFQPLLAIPLVLSTPVAVQAESVLDPDSVNLSFDHTTHEFELLVKTDQSLPYVLTYVDESQDPVMEQATTGQLEEIEAGVYGDTIYAGSCSGDVCTPNVVNSGVLQIGDQLKMEYRIVDGRVVMGGSSTEEIECIAPDTERLTSGDTLWDVDEEQQLAETNSAVTLGAVYQFPLDDKISVTFTCLPKDESARTSLKIQQIAVEELALPDTVKTDSKYAYDITTDMENGSFKYELTLPKEEGAEVEVQYIEKTLDEAKQEVKADEVKLVEPNESVKIEQVAEKKDVTVSGLDHFTIFVVVPSDIVISNLNLVSFSQQGWRMTSTGNANIALVDIASHSLPAGFGPHVVRTNRTGGTGNNRAYLGYYQPNLRLNQIESIKWNRYTKTGDDTYLNIYLRHPSNPLVTATVVAHPAITVGKWEQEVFDNSTTTGLTIRQGGTTNTITYAQLMSNYGNWLVRNDAFCKVSGWSCLNPANNVQIGGIVFVSGSSSPTAPQEHYYDGVTLDFTNQDPAYYNFVQTTPQLAAPENLGWNTRSGSSNPYDRPVDVECGGTTDADFPTYSNGQVAHNWSTDDTDSQLRFQRQWRWPGSGVWTTDPTIYSATNTTFATFGSDVGTEGTWNTRVRSWLDQNGNAVFDEGIDVVSEWSNECAVTYDRTMTSDVTVCKEDEQQSKLAGWSMYLKGATVQTGLSVPTNTSAGVNSASLDANTSYIAEASGTWTNQGGANPVDAEYSTTDVWITHVDGYTDRQTDILELQINSTFDPNSNWGAYNSAHKYVQSFVPTATGSANFRIFDGTGTTQNESWFGDNSGSLSVDISKGFAGITGQNGCVTFDDVPYGNYTLDEIMQDGWEYSGGDRGQVAIDKESVTYTLRNRTLPTPTPTITNERCGDGVVNQNNEQCDYGSLNGQSSCSSECTWVNECREAMVANGSFETPVVSQGDGWDTFENSEMSGWSASWYGGSASYNGHDRPEPQVELHRGVNGWLPASGSQYVELDVDWTGPVNDFSGEPASIALSQDIPTIVGNEYTVSWKYSARPNHNNNHLQVTVGDSEVFNSGIIAGGGNTNWQTQSYTFVTTTTLTRISFTELGTPDSLGMFLDDVQVNCNGLPGGDVSVYKYKDLNTNGTYDDDEPLLDDWEMVLASSSGELEQSTGDKGILGNTVFRVPAGTYTLSENMWEGWYQSAISCDSDPVEPTVTPTVTVYPSPSPCDGNGCASVDEPNWLDKILGVGIAFAEEVENEIAPNSKTVVVEAGKTTTCYVGNYQPSTIQGVKYFDANQDGTYDEGESKLPYWGISLTGPGVDQQVVTDENGAFSFNKLKAGTYTLCEENRTAWGWQVTEPAEPINTVCREVVIDRSGEIETHNFGNFIDSRLYIMKANNAWPTDQSVGTEVTYTIRVMAMGGPVTAAEVFDLPPQPFTYVPGSYTAESTKRGDLKGTTTTEPTYASPGVWQLGNLVKDEIVTLTYKAKIGSADPGIYPDMVWATGTSEQALAQGQTEGDLLALSNPALNESIGGVNFDGSQGHFGEDNFAGTQVAVVVDQTPSADHQVAVEVKETGSVLGASTELPATGGRFWISLIAILSVLVGGVMIYLGQKNRSATLTVALLVGLGLMMAPSAQAMTAVRIEQPYNTSTQLNQNASTNQRDMRVDFVVMNTAGLSVTAQCQQNKDGNGWSDITTQYVVKAGGNSGYCEAKNLGNQSNYDFRVRVTGDGADQYSATVRVGLDTNRPGTPINYGKFKGNDCEDVIKFRTADDNRTVRVDVYRSDNAEKFTANKDSRASQIPIGPKTDYTLTTSKPDCQKTYFYAVRAFDVNGNGSGLVGDENLTKVVVEGESEQAQTPTVGAVPVSNASGGSTTNLLTDQSLGGAGITESVVNDEGEEVRAEDEDADQTTSEEAGLEDTTEETESGAVLGESTGGGFFGWLGSLWQGFWGWLASLFGLN